MSAIFWWHLGRLGSRGLLRHGPYIPWQFFFLQCSLCHLSLKFSLWSSYLFKKCSWQKFVWLHVVKLISTDNMINDFLKGSYAHFCPLVLRWSDPFLWQGSAMNMMMHGLPTWIYLNISLMSAGYEFFFWVIIFCPSNLIHAFPPCLLSLCFISLNFMFRV